MHSHVLDYSNQMARKFRWFQVDVVIASVGFQVLERKEFWLGLEDGRGKGRKTRCFIRAV